MTFLRSRAVAVLGCFVLAGVAMAVDRAYPEQVSFETLYLVPVAVVTWRAGRPWGLGLAAATVVYMALDAMAAHDADGTITWNAIWWIALYAGVVLLVDRLATSQRQLRHLAYTDSLTGLANRRYFDEVVGAELERARRYRHPASLAVLDVNRFKSFNDARGHVAGDGMLRRIGAELRAGLRATDTIARASAGTNSRCCSRKRPSRRRRPRCLTPSPACRTSTHPVSATGSSNTTTVHRQ